MKECSAVVPCGLSRIPLSRSQGTIILGVSWRIYYNTLRLLSVIITSLVYPANNFTIFA